jgi:hypothetical protein
VWRKTEEKPNIKRSLGTAVLHAAIDNPESVVQVMRSTNIDQQLRKRTFSTRQEGQGYQKSRIELSPAVITFNCQKSIRKNTKWHK